MRPKFSLRALLLATTIVAATCYWLILPTVNAQRFLRAIAAGNYERADAQFRQADDRFLFDLNSKHWHFRPNAGLGHWSARQILRGERQITLRLVYGDATLHSREWTIVATRAGLPRPEPGFPSFGIGGGGGIDTPQIPTDPTS